MRRGRSQRLFIKGGSGLCPSGTNPSAESFSTLIPNISLLPLLLSFLSSFHCSFTSRLQVAFNLLHLFIFTDARYILWFYFYPCFYCIFFSWHSLFVWLFPLLSGPTTPPVSATMLHNTSFWSVSFNLLLHTFCTNSLTSAASLNSHNPTDMQLSDGAVTHWENEASGWFVSWFVWRMEEETVSSGGGSIQTFYLSANK